MLVCLCCADATTPLADTRYAPDTDVGGDAHRFQYLECAAQ